MIKNEEDLMSYSKDIQPLLKRGLAAVFVSGISMVIIIAVLIMKSSDNKKNSRENSVGLPVDISMPKVSEIGKFQETDSAINILQMEIGREWKKVDEPRYKWLRFSVLPDDIVEIRLGDELLGFKVFKNVTNESAILLPEILGPPYNSVTIRSQNRHKTKVGIIFRPAYLKAYWPEK